MDAFLTPVRRNTDRAAQDFLEQNVDGLLVPKTVGMDIYFNGTSNHYREFDDNTTERNVYAEAEKARDTLSAAMSDFQLSAQKDSPDRKNKMPNDSKKFQSWADVEDTVRDAQDKYKKTHGSTIQGSLQKLSDNIGAHGAAFGSWLALLPDGEYTSVICGAFNLVIKAAIRAKKVRDKIFDNLSRIPAVLDKAKDFLGMNNSYKSIKLHNAFSSLYSAIVNAFRHMLEWLQKSSFRHAAGAIFKGPDYGKLIDDSVAMVDTQAENVRQHAEICSYYMIGRIDHNITRQTVQLHGMTVTIEGVKDDIQNFGPMLQRMTASQENLGRKQDKTFHEVLLLKDTLNGMFGMFQSSKFVNAGSNAPRVTDGKNKRRAFNAQELIILLGCDTDQIHTDIARALSEGQILPSGSQDRTRFFTDSPRMKSWLTGQQSELLLVYGNQSNSIISPLTFASGIFLRSLRSYNGVIALSFFCSMHNENQKEHVKNVGASLMLANITSQLLNSCPAFDFSFLKKQDTWPFKQSDLRDGSPKYLRALCVLFAELMGQLPSDQIVFCVIDGIEFYEFGNRRVDTCTVMELFMDLMTGNHEKNIKALFKVLITTPGASLAVYEVVGRANIWRMPMDVGRSDQHFNSRRRAAQVDRDFEEMVGLHHENSHPDHEWTRSSDDENSGEGLVSEIESNEDGVSSD